MKQLGALFSIILVLSLFAACLPMDAIVEDKLSWDLHILSSPALREQGLVTTRTNLGSGWIRRKVTIRYNITKTKGVKYTVTLRTRTDSDWDSVEIENINPNPSSAREAAKIVRVLAVDCGFGKTPYGSKIIKKLDQFILGDDISWSEEGGSKYVATSRFGIIWYLYSEEIYIDHGVNWTHELMQNLIHESVHAYYGPCSEVWAQEEVQAQYSEALISAYLKKWAFSSHFDAIAKKTGKKTIDEHAQKIYRSMRLDSPIDYVDKEYVKKGPKQKWENNNKNKFPSNKLKGLWYK